MHLDFARIVDLVKVANIDDVVSWLSLLRLRGLRAPPPIGIIGLRVPVVAALRLVLPRPATAILSPALNVAGDNFRHNTVGDAELHRHGRELLAIDLPQLSATSALRRFCAGRPEA